MALYHLITLLSFVLPTMGGGTTTLLLSHAAPSCEHNITFFAPWSGGDAWLVNYTGPYSNDRPPHVQVGSGQLKNHSRDEFWCIGNCRAATASAIEFDVPGCFNSALSDVCHFTVFYGSGAKSQVATYCA